MYIIVILLFWFKKKFPKFTAEVNFGKGSERRKSLRRKSKKETLKCKSLKRSERRKSNLSDFQILKKCQLPMA